MSEVDVYFREIVLQAVAGVAVVAVAAAGVVGGVVLIVQHLA